MATLRELCNIVGIEEDPLGCAFAIACVMRSAMQGEPSTYEGECASLVKASEFFKVNTPDGIRKWLDDLGALAELDLPEPWLLKIFQADLEESDGEPA